MSAPYTSKEVHQIVGITKHVFDQWLQRGLAKPTIPSMGRGRAAKWDGRSIMALALTKALGDHGMVLRKAADVSVNMLEYLADMEVIDENHDHLPTAINLETGEWCGVEMVKRWDGYWLVFNVAGVVLDTLKKIQEVSK